jgi:hypothetical protein
MPACRALALQGLRSAMRCDCETRACCRFESCPPRRRRRASPRRIASHYAGLARRAPSRMTRTDNGPELSPSALRQAKLAARAVGPSPVRGGFAPRPGLRVPARATARRAASTHGRNATAYAMSSLVRSVRVREVGSEGVLELRRACKLKQPLACAPREARCSQQASTSGATALPLS